MKVRGLGLCLLLACVSDLQAQVTVEVSQEQDEFLQGESLPVAVRITNRSGQTLDLGADSDWLTFSVETRDGRVVMQTADVPVVGEFQLESSRAAVKHVDLAPYFVLSDPNRYAIIATVKIKNWGRVLESPPHYFDVIEGAKLWEQTVGVPHEGTAGGVPEVRKYILQQANYIKGQLRLYLRVTDGYGKIFRVCPVGPMVSFSRPDPQVDKLSQLHLLYQNGPATFSYSVFNLNGQTLVRQTYLYVDTRPRLRLDDDGNVVVQGGIRKVTPNDLPPPSPEDYKTPPLLPATNTTGPTNTPAGRAHKS